MKALSLLLRIVTLAIVIGLGVVWFLKKDEISAISETYEQAQTKLNMAERPLSEVMTKALNELEQTENELNEQSARVQSLNAQLASKSDQLNTTETQLRETTQTLRNTRRELETTQGEMAKTRENLEKQKVEVDTIRQDLIRVNQEKFSLNQKVEELESEKRSLSQRVQALEAEMNVAGPVSAAATGEETSTASTTSTGDQEVIASLEKRLDEARAEIQRLRSNPTGNALARQGIVDTGLRANQLKVSSIDLDRGIVVFTPSDQDELAGTQEISVSRDGASIANLRLRNIYPNYVVAEILPSSIFADAIKSGSVYSYTK